MGIFSLLHVKLKHADEAIAAAGRKPNMTPKAGLWPDEIIEIEPEGKTGGKIVWEWHIWDHLIQDFDSKKANYGKPANHPELLDFNVGRYRAANDVAG